ncbi:MADS-box transcription factor 30 [Zea mays]|uniref:MADS-box transcription factor 30 n=1 Tax=Zea mays TaxID=4577 RepID=UPI000221ADB8|eukprot:XP_008648980.1 MADS-box transcription factor 30 isoform X2 [Zea mays]
MGRGKVEMRRVENRVSRQVTFSKRRKGLLKKADELAVLCGVDVGVVVFSERGKLFEYSSPTSLVDLIRRYEAATSTRLLHQDARCCTDHQSDHQQQQMAAEISQLRSECEQLEASLNAYTGEDLSSVTSVVELLELEQRLESAIGKVRARKDELLVNLTEELQVKTEEHGRHDGPPAAAGVEATVAEPPLPQSPSFAYLLALEEKSAASTMLRLWPPTDEDADGGGSSSPRDLHLW